MESAPRAYRLKASNAAPPYFNIVRDNSRNGGKIVSALPLLNVKRRSWTLHLNGYNQHLRGCLIDSGFEPSQLAFVPVLHVLESAEQFLISKGTCTLF